MNTLDDSWWIYRGDRGPTPDALDRLPVAPPWRRFGAAADARPLPDATPTPTYRPAREVVELVNAALYLRKPMLVTGKPGTGKTSLARSIAWELGLGPVIVWPVNTRSTLAEGVSRYDAVGRLHAATLPDAQGRTRTPDIARYLRLGPLAEALLPARRPRVLLVDELDKGDVDLPNDLLHALDEGRFEVPELARMKGSGERLAARRFDLDEEVELPDGGARCAAYPVVVMTSNGERDFPAAFLRRCVQVRIAEPTPEQLRGIVAAHFGGAVPDAAERLLEAFLARRERDTLATDQLLNAVYLAAQGVDVQPRGALVEALYRALSEGAQ